jgi:hypothetical protein
MLACLSHCTAAGSRSARSASVTQVEWASFANSGSHEHVGEDVPECDSESVERPQPKTELSVRIRRPSEAPLSM